jgi:hypothetical protein
LSIYQVSLENVAVRGKGLALASNYWSGEILDFSANLLASLQNWRSQDLKTFFSTGLKRAFEMVRDLHRTHFYGSAINPK